MALHYGAILRQALLLEMLRRDAEKRKAADPLQRLAAFLDHDEFSGEKQLTAISEAFSDGRFTGVVLMDRLEERLRDLISFLNDSSRFQLIAVELNYYLHEGAEIVSPRLFGAEARHSQASSSEARGRWDETSFFTRLAERAPQAVAATRRLFDFAGPLGPVVWGSGSANPSFNAYIIPGLPRAPLTIRTDGSALVKLSWLMRFPQGTPFVDAAIPRLQSAGLPTDNIRVETLRWPAELWAPRVDEIINAFRAGLNVAGGA